VKSTKVRGGRLSPEKVYPETVVRIETQPGWGGVCTAAGGVGAGVVAGVAAGVLASAVDA